MNKWILNLLFLIFGYSCNAEADNLFKYPPEIEKLGLQKQFDETKWRLYCISLDYRLSFSRKPDNSMPNFGELPLEFRSLDIKHDTLILKFSFAYKGKTLKSSEIRNELFTGAIFKSSQIIGYSSDYTAPYIYTDFKNNPNKDDRRIIPLQPEVIKYIKANKSSLAPWFRHEAIKRGVINE